jgi:hypothetical protein
MENYYTPKIEEFHEGFEYEEKNSFGDGTVKTIEQYNLAGWEKRIFGLGIYPYLNRTMTGRNSKNLPSSVRVKYLDRDDIESLGWSFFGCPLKEDLKTCDFPIVYQILEEQKNTMQNRRILATLCQIKEGIYNIFKSTEPIEVTMEFKGMIKNKSELKKLMQQLNIL